MVWNRSQGGHIHENPEPKPRQGRREVQFSTSIWDNIIKKRVNVYTSRRGWSRPHHHCLTQCPEQYPWDDRTEEAHMSKSFCKLNLYILCIKYKKDCTESPVSTFICWKQSPGDDNEFFMLTSTYIGRVTMPSTLFCYGAYNWSGDLQLVRRLSWSSCHSMSFLSPIIIHSSNIKLTLKLTFWKKDQMLYYSCNMSCD